MNNYEDFANRETDHNIYASALYKGTKKIRNIIYKYENKKAVDINTGETFDFGMGSPYEHVMIGSIIRNLDEVINKLIVEGKIARNFDPKESYELIRDAFISSLNYKLSPMATYPPFDFEDNVVYKDDNNLNNKKQI